MSEAETAYPRLPGTWRSALAFLLGMILPGRLRRGLYRALLGYEIDRTAVLGPCFLRVQKLTLGPGAKIGAFTFIRNVREVCIGEESRIGTFNWIYGMIGPSDRHFLDEPDRAPDFIMEEQSSLTSRHIVDCTNRVRIGAFSTVAGFYSQILTHGIDPVENRQTSKPVEIGRYCLLGTGSVVLKGAVVPDGTVLGAGSVFRGAPTETHALYSGVPAEFIRKMPEDAAYFHRTQGTVD